jgi:hypothetical protein
MYSYYKLGGKSFLLFGDDHGSLEYPCVPDAVDVVDWLGNVLRNNKGEVIDMYIETHPLSIGPPGYPTTHHLGKVAVYFRDCIANDGNKDLCKSTFGRVHYIDTRYQDNTYLNKMVKKYNDVSQYVYPPDPQLIPIVNTFDIDNVITNLNKDKNRTDTKLKTAKQIGMIVDKTLVTKLENWRTARQQDISRQAAAVKKPTRIQDAIAKSNLLIALLSIEMDMYAIGRMFKTTKDSIQTTRVIVYAGSAHIDNYIDILKSFGATMINETHVKPAGSDEYRCVTLGDESVRDWVPTQ